MPAGLRRGSQRGRLDGLLTALAPSLVRALPASSRPLAELIERLRTPLTGRRTRLRGARDDGRGAALPARGAARLAQEHGPRRRPHQRRRRAHVHRPHVLPRRARAAVRRAAARARRDDRRDRVAFGAQRAHDAVGRPVRAQAAGRRGARRRAAPVRDPAPRVRGRDVDAPPGETAAGTRRWSACTAWLRARRRRERRRRVRRARRHPRRVPGDRGPPVRVEFFGDESSRCARSTCSRSARTRAPTR